MDLVAGSPLESFEESIVLIKNEVDIDMKILDEYNLDLHKRLLNCILPFRPSLYTDTSEEQSFETTDWIATNTSTVR